MPQKGAAQGAFRHGPGVGGSSSGSSQSTTNTNQFSLSATNQAGAAGGLTPTSERTNAASRGYSGTNQFSGSTSNLPPTGRDTERSYGPNDNLEASVEPQCCAMQPGPA